MRKTVNEQAEEILQKAEAFGVDKNFFFITTFRRYMVQLKILNELETAIKNDGVLVTKEYVKGRKNVYTNPAITEYNKTATAANGTVGTLMSILKQLTNDENGDEQQSKIEKFLKEFRDE